MIGTSFGAEAPLEMALLVTAKTLGCMSARLRLDSELESELERAGERARESLRARWS